MTLEGNSREARHLTPVTFLKSYIHRFGATSRNMLQCPPDNNIKFLHGPGYDQIKLHYGANGLVVDERRKTYITQPRSGTLFLFANNADESVQENAPIGGDV